MSSPYLYNQGTNVKIMRGIGQNCVNTILYSSQYMFINGASRNVARLYGPRLRLRPCIIQFHYLETLQAIEWAALFIASHSLFIKGGILEIH